jgi:hypothetical protein
MVEGLAKTEDLEGPSLTDDVAEGLTNDLLLVAFTLWLLGLWICSRDLPFLVALVVTSVKVAVPFCILCLVLQQRLDIPG